MEVSGQVQALANLLLDNTFQYPLNERLGGPYIQS